MSNHLPELTTPEAAHAAPPQGGNTSGPAKPDPRRLLDDARAAAADFDLKACEHLMRGGSKTFFAASKVLPDRVRGPATALYAFCRLADDTIDLHSDAHGGPAGAMAHLHERLRRLYAGQPLAVDADRALAAVVKRFNIPRALLLALLDGFQWDMDERRYDTLDDLHGYAARVAGTVGAMMALIMGTRSPQALARACELGVAMQLTNIARDVGEDARLGRLYLPRQWLREAGLDADAWLLAPSFSPALASVVARLLKAADALYRRAELGIADLPRDCRAAIQAARLVYAEIGREVERAGCDSVSQRAVVSTQRKLALVARAAMAALVLPRAVQPSDANLQPLPAIRFLVDVAAAPAHEPVPGHAAQAPLEGRLAWTISLFERQQQRHRMARAFPGSGQPRPSVFSG
jgi:15-cis-phytoene synthase